MFLFISNQSFNGPIILGIILFLCIFFLFILLIVAITNIIERNRTPFLIDCEPDTLVGSKIIYPKDPVNSTEYILLYDPGVSEVGVSEATVKTKRKYTRKPKEDTIPTPRKREPKTKPSIKKVNNE